MAGSGPLPDRRVKGGGASRRPDLGGKGHVGLIDVARLDMGQSGGDHLLMLGPVDERLRSTGPGALGSGEEGAGVDRLDMIEQAEPEQGRVLVGGAAAQGRELRLKGVTGLIGDEAGGPAAGASEKIEAGGDLVGLSRLDDLGRAGMEEGAAALAGIVEKDEGRRLACPGLPDACR